MNFQFFGAVAFFLVRPKGGKAEKFRSTRMDTAASHAHWHSPCLRPLVAHFPGEISETGGSASILIQLERMHRKLEIRRSGNAGVSLKQT